MPAPSPGSPGFPGSPGSKARRPPGRDTARGAVRDAVRDSVPIALGYFTVSLALGVFAEHVGLSVWLSGVMSVTSVSSSGEFAGLTTLAEGGTYLQLALGVALVNLRYVLMALSLGQRLGPEVGTLQRAFLAWGITDEIYALAMARRTVGFADYAASMALPILGWTAGTMVGAAVGGVLPPVLTSAFGVLLYAMFVAIVIPGTKASRPVLWVVLGAAALGGVLHLVPWLEPGWRVIIVAVLVAAVAATLAPYPQPPATAVAAEGGAETDPPRGGPPTRPPATPGDDR